MLPASRPLPLHVPQRSPSRALWIRGASMSRNPACGLGAGRGPLEPPSDPESQESHPVSAPGGRAAAHTPAATCSHSPSGSGHGGHLTVYRGSGSLQPLGGVSCPENPSLFLVFHTHHFLLAFCVERINPNPDRQNPSSPPHPVCNGAPLHRPPTAVTQSSPRAQKPVAGTAGWWA